MMSYFLVIRVRHQIMKSHLGLRVRFLSLLRRMHLLLASYNLLQVRPELYRKYL
jgi:hypothetical protein